MKASEFRIGNLIQLYRKPEDKEKTVFNISAIDTTETTDYIALSDGFVVNIDTGVEPIPLTEEWLVRLGFKKDGYDYWNGPTYFELAELSNGNWINSINCHEYNNGVEIKHIHQLQNLYFALTGEELVYKLNPSNTPAD